MTTRSATSISLGWLVHAALSLKARIARLVTRRSALHAPQPLRRAPSRRDRAAPAVEPRAVEAADDDEPETRTRTTHAPRGAASQRARRAGARARAAAICCPRSISARRAASHRPLRAEPGFDSGDTPRRSKACSAISACAARSSTPAPARWSRSTSSSPRPASSRRA